MHPNFLVDVVKLSLQLMNFGEVSTSLTGEIGITLKQGDVTYPNLGKKISTIMDVFFKQPNSKKKTKSLLSYFMKKNIFTR